MNTPPPPPLNHYRSASNSPYTIHTPDSQQSFNFFGSIDTSDRYSDAPLFRTRSSRPRIETRRPSLDKAETSIRRPALARRTTAPSVMESTENRDYLYFTFTKEGARWDEEPIVYEIQASEAEIKKKAESKNKRGTAIQHLQRMGPNRRNQIDRLISSLNAHETDGSTWEPVYLDNTKIKQRGTAMEVKTFEIILARKKPKSHKNGVGAPPLQPKKPQAEEAKVEVKEKKSKREKRKSKDKKADKAANQSSLVDDPFGETKWFDESGAALGAHDVVNSGYAGLPPYIPPEKPIGSLQPRIIQGLDPDVDGITVLDPEHADPHNYQPSGLGIRNAADDILRTVMEGDDDIIAVKGDRNEGRPTTRDGRDRGRRPSNRSRSRSRPRRFSHRRNSESGSRNVRFSGRFGSGVNFPTSSNSSMTSGEVGLMFDEVEELSSHTSEETAGSIPGQKVYRPIATAYRQHRAGPFQPLSPKQYELTSNEKVIMPARSQRRSSHAIEQPRVRGGYGVEQPLANRNTSPRYKPEVHQVALPPPTQPIASAEVPPIAVYPQYYEDRERRRSERAAEQHVTDYMRNAVREQNLKEREDELVERQRALQADVRREEERRQREMSALRDQLGGLRLRGELGANRRSVYNHEPRDRYVGRTL